MSQFRSKPKPDEPTKDASARNEYIPNFISKKPFYIDDALASDSDYLDHQRLQSQNNADTIEKSTWYDRGRAGQAATKYRKGACENCGAVDHKKKDCLQRTRKKGAKWTGQDIAADKRVQDINLGWDAKRDRWNGFDARDYDKVVAEYAAMEELPKPVGGGDDTNNPDKNDRDGALYADEADMSRHQPSSTRQLRLREDTANYLLNLDADSANYDPKTRTMADSGAGGDAAAALVAEQGFARAAGDAAEFEKAARYAWEAQERGDKDAAHLQANPTAGALNRKRELEADEAKKSATKKMLLDKYGVQESYAVKDKTSVVENETYVEYDSRGRVKGHGAVGKKKSMYVEDVLINNHTAVWGSWWRDFKWGYACCHSVMKNSYCVGPEGLKAVLEAEAQSQLVSTNETRHTDATDDQQIRRIEDAKTTTKPIKPSDQVTEEQMEEYRRQRTAENDPMAKFLAEGAS